MTMTRMRVVHVTGESYLLVFDQASDPEQFAPLFSDSDIRSRLTGCAGVLVFASDLEVE